MDKAINSGNCLTLLILHWFDAIDCLATDTIIALCKEIGCESGMRCVSRIPSVFG